MEREVASFETSEAITVGYVRHIGPMNDFPAEDTRATSAADVNGFQVRKSSRSG